MNSTYRLPNGYTYLVVEGALTNVSDPQLDQPASAYPHPGFGVAVPLAALISAGARIIGKGDSCRDIIFFIGLENAHSLPGGLCLLVLNAVVPPGRQDAAIPSGRQTRATYMHPVPARLRPDQIRLVGFDRRPRSHITSSNPLPWSVR